MIFGTVSNLAPVDPHGLLLKKILHGLTVRLHVKKHKDLPIKWRGVPHFHQAVP
jgi:hypothetical protein